MPDSFLDSPYPCRGFPARIGATSAGAGGQRYGWLDAQSTADVPCRDAQVGPKTLPGDQAAKVSPHSAQESERRADHLRTRRRLGHRMRKPEAADSAWQRLQKRFGFRLSHEQAHWATRGSAVRDPVLAMANALSPSKAAGSAGIYRPNAAASAEEPARSWTPHKFRLSTGKYDTASKRFYK